MPPLHAALTAVAPADVDVELPIDRLAWNLDLVCLLEVGFLDGTAAVVTGVGQWGLVGFVDLFGRRWRPMGFGAVVVAAFAAGLPGFVLAAAFGKGGGLAFAGAAFGFEKLQQPLLLG